ncbi:hypothetical protein [Metamycoplasma buccale]|uniref:hypothetical protein n=1 Tax=Metamycoplasma buccale TaxID=55602 RepID=UPI00398F8109
MLIVTFIVAYLPVFILFLIQLLLNSLIDRINRKYSSTFVNDLNFKFEKWIITNFKINAIAFITMIFIVIYVEIIISYFKLVDFRKFLVETLHIEIIRFNLFWGISIVICVINLIIMLWKIYIKRKFSDENNNGNDLNYIKYKTKYEVRYEYDEEI